MRSLCASILLGLLVGCGGEGAVEELVADVSNNFFGGHLGADVYVESFTSTVDPAATAGTWNATEFDITNIYRSDPLARLASSVVLPEALPPNPVTGPVGRAMRRPRLRRR